MKTETESNIVNLSGGSTGNTGLSEFQRIVAANVDAYAKRFGREPQSLVFVLSDADGNVLPSWLMREECEGRSFDKIALASVVLSWTLKDTGDDA